MSKSVFHPSLHFFTNFSSANQIKNSLAKIKKSLFTSSKANIQFALQTEFIAPEFHAHSLQKSLALLDERLDLMLEAGFAVHLLLPFHQGIPENWPGATVFAPAQPTLTDEDGPYDRLSREFQIPVIQHLVKTGRAQKLAVIYIANEFGYSPDVIKDTSKDWGGVRTWQARRQEALAKTLIRLFDNAVQAAQGAVPIGVKFARLHSPKTGWTPHTSTQTDWLKWSLQHMAAQSGVLGYDVYYPGVTGYDAENRARLLPFLPLFADGRFEIAETGRECRGKPGEFLSGHRTTAEDILNTYKFWPEARGFNLFAWNASGPIGGCYSLTDPHSEELYPGADQSIKGLCDLAVLCYNASK